MANIKSQIKRNRSNERRRQRNLGVRSELKTRVKHAREAIDAGTEDAPEMVRAAQKRLGMAAAKGRIHKRQAARRTSRMMKRANASASRGIGTERRATGGALPRRDHSPVRGEPSAPPAPRPPRPVGCRARP